MALAKVAGPIVDVEGVAQPERQARARTDKMAGPLRRGNTTWEGCRARSRPAEEVAGNGEGESGQWACLLLKGGHDAPIQRAAHGGRDGT